MRLSVRRSARRRSRGQGLVEFAIIAPVLFTLVFGVFDFGRAMSANVTVTNSSREGARYLIANAVTGGSTSYWNAGNACPSSSGTVSPTSNSGEDAAWRQLQTDNLDTSKVSMTIYFYQSGNDPGSDSSRTNWNLKVTCPTSGSATESASPSTYTPSSGDWVVFTTTYTYNPITPFISLIFKSVTITQTTTMVVE